MRLTISAPFLSVFFFFFAVIFYTLLMERAEYRYSTLKESSCIPSTAGEACAEVIGGWESSISGVFFVELILLIYACTSTWKHPVVSSGTDELWNERSFSSFFLARSLSLSDSFPSHLLFFLPIFPSFFFADEWKGH